MKINESKAARVVAALLEDGTPDFRDDPQHQQKDPQELADGTRVRFNLRDISPREFGDLSDIGGEGSIEEFEGATGTIESLDVCSGNEEPNKDFEYYTVKFDNGTTLHAVSGYHFTPIQQ